MDVVLNLVQVGAGVFSEVVDAIANVVSVVAGVASMFV
jgi:hypothetical protein